MFFSLFLVLFALVSQAAPIESKNKCEDGVDKTVRAYIQSNWVLSEDKIQKEDAHFWESQDDQQFRYGVSYYFKFRSENRVFSGKVVAKAYDVADGLPCSIGSLVFYRNTYEMK